MARLQRLGRTTIAAEGVYFIVTGAWPLLGMRVFERVTGPKADDWLVHMVGVLAIVIGATLLFGLRDRDRDGQARLLAVLAALGFLVIDVVYVLREVIRPIYLADAAIEVIFVALIALSEWRRVLADRSSGRWRAERWTDLR